MTRVFKAEDTKDSHVSIPTICIEGSYCSNSMVSEFQPCGLPSPFFVSDGDALFERPIPVHLQASQFICWFSELAPAKQFIFTALSLQYLSNDYVKLAQGFANKRLLNDHSELSISSKARDIGYLNNLCVSSEDFCSTIFGLLLALDVPEERDVYFCHLHDKYLSLVDKAMELAVQHNRECENRFDSPEGQLLLIAMSTPIFTHDDRQWLMDNIKTRCDGCAPNCPSNSLLNLANDLLELFDFHQESGDGSLYSSKCALSKNLRSASISSHFPFLQHALYPFLNRRHHSLVAPTTDTSLSVPSPFAPAHHLSSSSLNSSGFVSGSESIHQGLNEPMGIALRGNRFVAPSANRFYLLRRQSASPYTFQGEQLKEEEDGISTTAFYSDLAEKNGSRSCLILPISEEKPLKTESFEGLVMSPDVSQRHSIALPHEISHAPIKPDEYFQVFSEVSSAPFLAPPATGDVLNVSPLSNGGSTSNESSQQSFVNLSENREMQGQQIHTPRHGCRKHIVGNNRMDEPGMAYVPLWLKSLRLHKYIGLFQRLTYSQMLGINDEWLQRQHVTQGARNKILVSINNLRTRSETLTRLEERLVAAAQNPIDRGSNLRNCLSDLCGILQTPFPPAAVVETTSPPYRVSSTDDSAPATVAPGSECLFSSDVDEYVEDDSEEPAKADDEGDFQDFHAVSGGLCRCPYTSSDTCLFNRTHVDRASSSPKRPKSTEGGLSPGATSRIFFNATAHSESSRRNSDGLQRPTLMAEDLNFKKGTWSVGENLPDQIMLCLQQGFYVLLCEPKDDQDNYGFFMHLLTFGLEHPSFSRSSKDQLILWQKQLVDRLGPAPAPPRRSYHHRTPSRRNSHYQRNPGRGDSFSAPYTPRGGNVVCGVLGSQTRFVSPLRLPYHQQQHPQIRSATAPFLQPPAPFGMGPNWGGGIVRGRSAEPDAYHQRHHNHHHHHPSGALRLSFQDQTALTSGQYQRVASMDSLAAPTQFTAVDQRMVAHLVFNRNRVTSYHGPLESDISPSSSPFDCFSRSPVGGEGDCFNVYPTAPSPRPGNQEQLHQLPITTVAAISLSDYSTAEINRNLDLLTEKVTKLAIDESDSPSE